MSDAKLQRMMQLFSSKDGCSVWIFEGAKNTDQKQCVIKFLISGTLIA